MGVLFPLQPGDPTKLPAAILRGAPFGLSSPAASQHVLAFAAAMPPYHDEGIALVSRVVKMSK